MSRHSEINETESSVRIVIAAEIGRSHESSFCSISSLNVGSTQDDHNVHGDAEYKLHWVQRLPTFERITAALFCEKEIVIGTAAAGNTAGKQVVNITQLGAEERHVLIEKLIKHIENDVPKLLQKLRGWTSN